MTSHPLPSKTSQPPLHTALLVTFVSLSTLLLLACEADLELETSAPGSGKGGTSAGASRDADRGKPPTTRPAGRGGHAAEGPEPAAPDLAGNPGVDRGGGTSARMFLPTAEPVNTRAPRIALDAAGNLHAVYPVYAGGDAYYAFCPDQCSDPAALEVVQLPTEGTVLNAMLALTRTGRPRVLLATALAITWAECDQHCGQPEQWQAGVILDHGGDRELTGQAFALDPDDRPRFMLHTYLATLGIGQHAPQTLYAQCDGGCADAQSWRIDPVQDQIMQHTSLRFDAAARAHVATVAVTVESGGATARHAAYAVCEDDCGTPDAWSGIVLMPAYENYQKEIRPSVALSLTDDGGPRIAMLGRDDAGSPLLTYFECDANCEQDNWRAAVVSDNAQLGSGVDLALDAQQHPRLAFTLGDNIGIYHCDTAACTAEQATWTLSKVELAAEVPPDGIILWPNCTVDAWSLHDPSLALGAGQSALVGYQATDLSGGLRTIDPTNAACLAGKDMTLTRLARLPSF